MYAHARLEQRRKTNCSLVYGLVILTVDNNRTYFQIAHLSSVFFVCLFACFSHYQNKNDQKFQTQTIEMFADVVVVFLCVVCEIQLSLEAVSQRRKSLNQSLGARVYFCDQLCAHITKARAI